MPRSLSHTAVAALLLAALATFSPTPARATCDPSRVTLSSGLQFTAGVSPMGVVLVDQNGDGVPDALVALSHVANGTTLPGEVAFLRGIATGGLPTGTFAPPTPSNAGITPFAIATADLDHDGVPDAVVTNLYSNTVSVLIGTGANGHGDGLFAPPVAYTVGTNAHHLVLADFNGDGNDDIAVTNNGSATVSVLIGRGDGTFGPATSYAVRGYPAGIAAGDVDGDGINDLIVAEEATGSLAILKGNGSGGVGNGTFTVASHVMTGGMPYDVQLADVNGDHKLDLLVGLVANGGLLMLPGVGDGTFGTQVHVMDGSVSSVRVADMDGDGTPDLVATVMNLNRVSVLHGNGDGTFAPRVDRPVGASPLLCGVGDWTGDGLLDVLVGQYSADMNVTLLRGDCSPVPLTFSITGVRDVPNDQGGKVWVTWPANQYDAISGNVTSYRVWRRIVEPSAALRLAGRYRVTPARTGLAYWEEVARLDAQRLLLYGCTVATAQDSMAGSNPYTAFFVTAATADPNVFYDTPVDSGYSVDNLAPAALTQVESDVYPPSSNGVLRIYWSAGTESDLRGYRFYHGATPFFVPSAANLALTAVPPQAKAIIQPDWTGAWKITAVDVHGNESPAVLVLPGVDNGALAPWSTVELVSATPAGSGTTLTWYADPHVLSLATLERAQADSTWRVIGSAEPDSGGRLVFEDAGVVSGTYAYRLRWQDASGAMQSVPETVTLPPLALAVGAATPVAATRLALRFALPDASPATLALYDVAGRRVVSRDVGALGAGTHVVDLAGEHLRAGVYLAKLTQGGREAKARIVVL